MKNVIPHLGNALENYFKLAEEIYIATALMDEDGLSIIKEALELKNRKICLLLGVDLPTSHTVLDELNKLPITTKIYTEEEKTFHPKMYLFRINDSYTGFIGSGNFTHARFNNNIELNYKIEDQEECLFLIEWFDKIQESCINLNDDFLEEYSKIERPNPELERIKELKNNYKPIAKTKYPRVKRFLKYFMENQGETFYEITGIKEKGLWVESARLVNSGNNLYISLDVRKYNPNALYGLIVFPHDNIARLVPCATL